MIEITDDVRPSMAVELKLQPLQKNDHELTPDALAALIQSGRVWAVKVDGRVVALGGYTPIWAGRAMVWGALSLACRPAMLTMTKRILRELEKAQVEFPRLEAYADRHSKEARRWLLQLGFKREGTMQKFANGRDFTMFARVR